MKIRLDFVSNSSSSSFVIAYDKKVFGNLEKFFKDYSSQIGYSTSVKSVSQFLSFFDESTDDWAIDLKKLVEDAKKNKLGIVCLNLDNEHYSMIDLLKFIGEKHNGEFKILYGDDE